MSTTRLQEILICFGKQKQTDIATANTAGQMWQLRKLNAGIVTVAVECLPMWDATNGIISAVAKCGVDSICQ